MTQYRVSSVNGSVGVWSVNGSVGVYGPLRYGIHWGVCDNVPVCVGMIE